MAERYQAAAPIREIGIGLLGLGTVGSGVAHILATKRAELEREIGLPVSLRKALIRDLDKRRDYAVDPAILTTDPADVLDNPDVNMVVEVLGVEEPAGTYLRRAMEAGKHVVTANKELVAKQGASLLALAAKQNVDFHYEASVGSGIPLIGPFKQDLAANTLTRVKAIINGTTNYILTRMSEGGVEFSEALAEAQRLGYAEPDPTNDVEGKDAVYKLAILATLAFKTPVHPDQVYSEGITKLTSRDFRYAAELGYTIKLLAMAAEDQGQVEVRVHPAFLESHALLARVDGVYNAVQVHGDLVGRVMFTGRGAGAMSAASGIIADVIDIAQDVQREMGFITPVIHYDDSKRVRSIDEVRTRFFIRMEVEDRPGVLAQVALAIGQEDISIASIVQKEVNDAARSAEIVIITHTAREGSVLTALTKVRALPAVRDIGSVIRIEEED